MPIEEHYRVPREEVSYEQFAAAAVALGLSLQNRWGGPGEDEPLEEVWASADRSSAINYSEDAISEMPYLCIRQQVGSALLTQITAQLACYAPQELLAYAITDPPRAEMVNTLFRIGITFPEYDSDVANVVGGAALRHPDANVRACAIAVIHYRRWALLRTVVDVAAHNDPVAEVRQRAQGALASWEFED